MAFKVRKCQPKITKLDRINHVLIGSSEFGAIKLELEEITKQDHIK